MTRTTIVLMAIFLVGCQKEDNSELNQNPSHNQNPTPSIIQLSYSEIAYPILTSTFSYTDVYGVYHANSIQMDLRVENVDFLKPIEVRAQAGFTMYPVGQSPQPYPQTCSWVLKKDGYVIDSRTTSNYVYQN
jgi:hypothetical protein